VLRSFIRSCVLLLVREQPAHGYELVERLRDIGVSVSDPGTLYRSLHAMEEQGLLSSCWRSSNHGPERRVYSITEHGWQALERDADALLLDERALTEFFARHRAWHAQHDAPDAVSRA
jgi:PadR family transcriptional regulator